MTYRRKLLPRCQVGQAGQPLVRKVEQGRPRPRRQGPEGRRVPVPRGDPRSRPAGPEVVWQHADDQPDCARPLPGDAQGQDRRPVCGRPQAEQAADEPALRPRARSEFMETPRIPYPNRPTDRTGSTRVASKTSSRPSRSPTPSVPRRSASVPSSTSARSRSSRARSPRTRPRSRPTPSRRRRTSG